MLTVEDGTGIETANTYIDIPYVEAYLLGEKLSQFQALTDDEKEAAILSAVRYVDAAYNWIGTRKTLEKGLAWPRLEAVYQGFTIEGIPSALKRSCAEAVVLTMGNADGLSSTDGNRVVTSVSVSGAVSETYSYDSKSVGKIAETKYEALNNILRGLYIPSSGASIGCASVIRG